MGRDHGYDCYVCGLYVGGMNDPAELGHAEECSERPSSGDGLTRAEIEATLSASEGMADLPKDEKRMEPLMAWEGVIPPTSRAGDEPMYAWLLELLRDRFSGLPAGLQKAIAWEICGAVKERFGERALLFPYSFHGLTRAEIDPQDDSK
jgi:hypothetical protein